MWSFNNKRQNIETDKTLRIEALAPAWVHWSADSWLTVEECETRDTGLGVHLADLKTSGLTVGAQIVFTFFWPQASRWEAIDFSVRIAAPIMPITQNETF